MVTHQLFFHLFTCSGTTGEIVIGTETEIEIGTGTGGRETRSAGSGSGAWRPQAAGRRTISSKSVMIVTI